MVFQLPDPLNASGNDAGAGDSTEVYRCDRQTGSVKHNFGGGVTNPISDVFTVTEKQ